jgi:hypothetical protein
MNSNISMNSSIPCDAGRMRFTGHVLAAAIAWSAAAAPTPLHLLRLLGPPSLEPSPTAEARLAAGLADTVWARLADATRTKIPLQAALAKFGGAYGAPGADCDEQLLRSLLWGNQVHETVWLPAYLDRPHTSHRCVILHRSSVPARPRSACARTARTP